MAVLRFSKLFPRDTVNNRIERELQKKMTTLDTFHVTLFTLQLMEDGTAKINMAAPERPLEETRLGCPFHVSDEMYRNYGTGPAHESYAIYAFGMLLWVLCEGSGAARPQSYKTRQTNAAMQTAVQNGVIPERPPEVTDDCWLLMISCWRDRRRISIDEIIVLVNKLQH